MTMLKVEVRPTVEDWLAVARYRKKVAPLPPVPPADSPRPRGRKGLAIGSLVLSYGVLMWLVFSLHSAGQLTFTSFTAFFLLVSAVGGGLWHLFWPPTARDLAIAYQQTVSQSLTASEAAFIRSEFAKANDNIPFTFEITECGVEVSWPHHRHLIAWAGIEHVVTVSSHVFLKQVNADYLFVPRRAFPDDDSFLVFSRIASEWHAARVPPTPKSETGIVVSQDRAVPNEEVSTQIVAKRGTSE